MTALLPHHLAHLRTSGLSDETIRAAGIRSETDPIAVSRILGWDRPAHNLGPCIVIPFRHLDGSLNGFARIRPDKPRTDKERGRAIKYEQPRNTSPRIYLPPGTVETVGRSFLTLGFTEGEKKGLAADQEGFPCIGLTGVWSWQKAGSDPRELTDELAAIDWMYRPVWFAFDTDDDRNQNVNHARAEFARVLISHGAFVTLVDLPRGPRDEHGRHTKTGLDDLLVRVGSEAFRRYMADATDPPPTKYVPLDEIRWHMERSRYESVDSPGVYCDASPTGSGKTHADRAAMRRAGTSIIILPTHKNCRELSEVLNSVGLPAEAYPALTGAGEFATCRNFTEAESAMEVGLSPSNTVCLSCEFREDCVYRAQLAAAETAAHSIATHTRAELSFEQIATGKRYVSVHEDCTAMLRPIIDVNGSLEVVIRVAMLAGSVYATRQDNTGRHAAWSLEQAARFLQDRLSLAKTTESLDMPAPAGLPKDFDRVLFRVIQEHGLRPGKDAMRLCRAIVGGDLAELTVRVDDVFTKGGERQIHKAVLGVKQTVLPANAAVWLNDATADVDELSILSGHPVTDMTPRGTIELRHPIVQYTADIKQSTSPATVLKLLRAILASYSAKTRIGVICHRRHVGTVRGTGSIEHRLTANEQQRIAKVEYFRGGDSRGSNEWQAQCDLIAILGTPRVPPSVIRTRLLQTGQSAAAARDGKWGRDYWSAVTSSGARRTVTTSGYMDWDWYFAHRAVVRAELVQAIGRGRGICEDGIPVIVLSNEDLGLAVADEDIEPMPTAARLVLETMQRLLTDMIPTSEFCGGTVRQDSATDCQNSATDCKSCEKAAKLTDTIPTSITLGNRSVSSQAIASATKLTERHIRRILADLSRRGVVQRNGQRGGWMLSPTHPSR